jgi:hypothetical protein
LSHRSELLATAFGVIAFTLGVIAYLLGTNSSYLLPFDIAALVWLIYDINVPRLILGYDLPPVTASPFIVASACSYVGLTSGRSELTYPAMAVIITCFLFALVQLNKFIEPEKLHGSLRGRLEASERKNLLEDSDYPRKKAILFWGLIKIKEAEMLTLGDVLLLPVTAAFFGLLLIVYALTLASKFGPLLLIETIVIVALNFLRLGKTRIRKLLRMGPTRFLVEAWSATDRVEEGFSKRIIRLLRKPYGLLYFWGLIASTVFAVAAVYVFGSFVTVGASVVLGMRNRDALRLISTLVLLNFGYLPAFLFPVYLSLSMIRFTYDRGSPQLPRYPLLWLTYSILTLSFFIVRFGSNHFGVSSSLLILGPACIGTLLILSALFQEPVPVRKRDEVKFAIGILVLLAFFVVQAGGNQFLTGAGIGITILLWYSISLLMSESLARPFSKSQKVGVVSLSATFALASLIFVANGDTALGLLAGFGSLLVWFVLLPKEKTNKVAKNIFGISEEIIER